jgi:hypothetical protein
MDQERQAICAVGHTRDEIRDGYLVEKTAMSAIGTKQTSACALHMPAFDPKRTCVPRISAWIKSMLLQPFGRID